MKSEMQLLVGVLRLQMRARHVGSCFQSRADQKIQTCIHHCGHNLVEIIDILLSAVCSFLSVFI